MTTLHMSKLFLIQIFKNCSFEKMMSLGFFIRISCFLYIAHGIQQPILKFQSVFLHVLVYFWSGQSSFNQSWNQIRVYIFLFNFSLYFLIDREIEKHLRESVSNQATLDAKMKTHTRSMSFYISPPVSYLLEPSFCKKRQKKSQPRNWFR